MDRRIGGDQWNALIWWKIRSIIPFNLSSFGIYSDWQRLRVGQHLREQYNTNTTVLINNKAADWGLYLRVKVWYLAHTVLSISNNLSYVAYLAQPTTRFWNRQTLKCVKPLPVLVITMFVYLLLAPSEEHPALLRRQKKALKVEIRHTFQSGPKTTCAAELFP